MVDRVNWHLLFTEPKESPALDAYFERYAQPVDFDRHPCMKCGTRGCGFTYGIVMGAGHCIVCGWPARRDHKILGVEVKGVVLQYHPDYVIEGVRPDPFTGFPYQLTVGRVTV